ncbi:MAG: dihydrolipoamide acetyltransferase family protein [Brevefilum sp.]|nr:dihydrolipoamide acetyltransferase family protein [Brevefilum sp.]
MPTPFIMPKMDMDQESVFIVEWLKKEGELVEKGEPVIIVETDKITSEVEAPASGKLAHILYGENVEAPVTEVIAYILAEGESEADLPDSGTQTAPAEEVLEETEESAQPKETPGKIATPLAARMAKEKNLDLSLIPAEGEKITKDDIVAYLKEGDQVQPRVKTPATPAARRLSSERDVALDQVEGSGPRGRVQAADVLEAASDQKAKFIGIEPSFASGETVPLSNMRRRIADRLTASYQETPHIYLTVEVDMFEAEQSRKRMNTLAVEEGSSPISVTAYLVRTVAWALKGHSMLNASLTDEGIAVWEDINIGVATSIDEGLIVSVIPNADRQSIREINQKLRYLTKQAREGALTREEVQGGTFTISNLGMYGIQSFTAIINPPQSAILAVGALKRKPIVVDDQDNIAVRPMMIMTLGVDHRLVDGAVAAAFLAELVKAVENPEYLLM